MASWTDKQKRFVEEYCVDCNATQAAIRAGYSEKTARQSASRLMNDPDIRKAIEERMEELAMSAAEATKRLTEIARGDLGEFFSIEEDEEGNKYARLDLVRLIEEGPSHLVKKMRYTKQGPQIEAYDKQSALKTILDAHGAFNHKQEHEHAGKDGGPIQHQWGPPRDTTEDDE